MRAIVAALLLLCLFSSTSIAQDLVGAPPRAPEVLTAEEENPEEVLEETPVVDDSAVKLAEGNELIGHAIEQHEIGASARAEKTLERFITRFPEHPRMSEAMTLLGNWREERATAEAELAAKAQTDRRRSDGRSLLIVGQGLHGVGIGLELWTLLYDDDAMREGSAEAALGFGTAGLVGGIVTSLLLSKGGIEPGHASALNSGSLWGFFLAFTATQSNYSLSGRPRAVGSILGQAAGMGLAEGAWRLWEPTHGQTWVVDSTAFWTTMFATGAVLAVTNYDFPPRRPVLAGTHFWAATGGLALGGLIAKYTPSISVGRLVLINSMGVAGAIVTPILGAWIAQGFYELTPGWLLSMSGAAVGLGLTTLLTRNWKAKSAALDDGFQLHLGLVPVEGGAGLGLGGQF